MITPGFLRRLVLAFLLGVPGLAVSRAPAQIVISSVPYTISAAGRYILGGNLTSTSTAAPAITVAAPNVVLDLDGHYLAGPGNSNAGGYDYNSVIDIYHVPNVTIRNGTISGNVFGILISSVSAADSRNYHFDSLVVTRCYECGIYFGGGVPAPGSVVRNCSFTAIGNYTYAPNESAAAIQSGGGVRTEKNTIGDVTATGSGTSYGIFAAAGDFEIGNTITGCYYAISGGNNLNNLTSGCTMPFIGGTNATGNH